MSRMRRRTWVVWGVLGLLVAAVFLLQEGDGEDDDGHGHGSAEHVDSRWLVPAPADELGVVEVVHEGNLHRFERDAAGLWFYHGVHGSSDPQHGHTTDPVLAAKIETSLIGFSRTRKERHIPLSEGPEKFGVTAPQMIVLVYAKAQVQPLAQYAIGDSAPDRVSRYVMRVGDSEIVTIPDFQIDNLLNLIKMAQAAGTQPGPAESGS